MKKISLLILLALTITVGGVYAAWSYAENKVSVVTDNKTALGVTDAITSTSKGSIAITNLLPTLSINDNSTTSDPNAPGDYQPEWDAAIKNGEMNNLTISFTTNSGAKGDESGYIYILVALVLQGDNDYNGNKIFNIEDKNTGNALDEYIINDKNGITTNDTVFHYAIIKCEVDDAGAPKTFTRKVTPEHFIEHLPVNGNFKVPTITDYEEYVTAVESNKIHVVVTEVPTTLANGAEFSGGLIECDEVIAAQNLAPIAH